MSVKKRYVFLIFFLFCLLGVFAFFVYRFFFADELGVVNSRISFEWLIEPRFHKANDFRHGVTWVQERENGPWKLIDTTGKVLVDHFQVQRVFFYGDHTDLAMFRNHEDFRGYTDLSGDIAIHPQYQFAGLFMDGVAIVAKRIDTKVQNGVINQRGEIILPIAYEGIVIFHSGLFAGKKNGKWGYLNGKGEVIADFIFEEPPLLFFKPPLYPAILNQKVGLLNEKGQWVLPASFENAYGGREGLVALGRHGKVGFVDEKGNTVIDFQFVNNPDEMKSRYFYTFSEGLAAVLLPEHQATEKDKNHQRGVIDRTGKVLFTFQGKPIAHMTKYGLLVMTPGKTYELITPSGERYSFPSYIEIDDYDQGGFAEGILRVKMRKNTGKYEKDKYGYLKVNIK